MRLIIYSVLILLFSGCGQSELQKVLDHYSELGNSEKLEAANFLIKNLDLHESFDGKEYDRLSSFYEGLNNVIPQKRLDTLSNFLTSTSSSDLNKPIFDKDALTAESLIKHIDFAYLLWKRSPWFRNVSFNHFCEYLLPYKVYNEGFSDWISLYNERFKDAGNTITFESGQKYRALDAKHKPKDTIALKDYDVTTLVVLNPKSESIIFDSVISQITQIQNLHLHYSTTGTKYCEIKLSVNKIDTIIKLKPTTNLAWFPFKRSYFPINLRKGVNTIELKPLNDSVGIDYIEILPYEKFYRNSKNYHLTDGASYKIRNVQTGNYLSIDSSDQKSGALTRGKYFQGISSQIFNIQNVDYGFFKISPKHILDLKKSLEVRNTSTFNYDSVGQWDYWGGGNQQWAIIPVRNNIYKILNRWNGKCLQPISDSLIVQNDYSGLESQHWEFTQADSNLFFDSTTHIKQDSPLEYVLRLAEVIDFDFVQIGLPDMKASSILEAPTGSCIVEAQYIFYILRSLGIPSAVDYIPQDLGPNIHYWNAIIDSNGKKTFFQNGRKPGTGRIGQPVAKVFRNTFSYNKSNLFFNKDILEAIPDKLNSPFIHDITDEYTTSRNVSVSLFNNFLLTNYRHCYLSIFNNESWVPVDWATQKGASADFKNVGVDILYLPVFYSHYGSLSAAGYPIILYKDSVTPIIPDLSRTQTLTLKRKYRWTHDLDSRLNGGRFQGANKPDFSDSITLYTFFGKSEPLFYDVKCTNNKKFKYVRYLGPDGSFCNINEIALFNNQNEKLTGKIIGTQGSFKNNGKTKEKVFDGDILTSFDAPIMNGAWVGLEFDLPKKIHRIRFIPRNDGNCVEIGDTYELVYWNNQSWESLGTQKARTDSIVFENCPSNALFLLHNKTKGKEERIFTIQDGKQVWW